ncbi:MAG: hypothetical protein P4L99_28610 [Chthoniobacter sp.]|nr:hypothetical protein [Chthoniobacter sp.]
MRTKHADHGEDLRHVIQDCHAAGFIPNFIIEGLHEVFDIPRGEAKRLVVFQLYSKEARDALDELHSVAEAVLRDDKDK